MTDLRALDDMEAARTAFVAILLLAVSATAAEISREYHGPKPPFPVCQQRIEP